MNILLCILIISVGQTDTTTKVVNYSSKNIVYYPKENRIVLLDSAKVSYGDVLVNADSVEYDIKTKILSAYKNVHFLTATEKVDGTELHYNLSTKRGLIYIAKTTVENGFVNGKEIWLIKEKTLEIVDGYYTTCDHDPPHYYFYGRKSKVLLDNTAITQGVVLKIHGIPCAVAPFWFFPISKNRKSGLLPFKFGQSNTEGRYLKGVSYYLVINDYSDMTFMLDVMEKKGFQPKIEGIYIINPFASGQVLGSYIYELDTKRGRYSFNAKHHSQFLFNSNLDAYIDIQSDQSYLPDYAENTAQWLKKELYSTVTVDREFKKVGRMSLTTVRQQDFEKQILNWIFPNMSINFYRLPLIGNWSVTPGFGFSNLQKRYDSSSTNLQKRDYALRSFSGRFGISNPKTILGVFDLPISASYKSVNDKYGDTTTIDNQEFNAGTGFSSSQTIFQALNISEGISYNHRLTFEDSVKANVQYDFNFGSNITLNRLFSIGIIGIENILHRVTPSMGFNFTPHTKQGRIWGVPRLDTTPQSASVGFSLNNSFQGKFTKIDEKKDIATIVFQSSYDFKEKVLSPLALNSDLYLISKNNTNLTSNISLSYPWQKGSLSQVNISNLSVNSNFNYSLTKKDSLGGERGVTFYFNHFLTAYSNDSSRLTLQSNMLSTIISVSPKGWRFDFNAGYNFKEKNKLTNYSISVWKDLHCWEAIVDFNKFGPQWSYDFKVRIKKIPDVTVGKGILGFVLPFK
jgi:lipopolysaccharide assembly outer membrane protein LptD (OstA)